MYMNMVVVLLITILTTNKMNKAIEITEANDLKEDVQYLICIDGSWSITYWKRISSRGHHAFVGEDLLCVSFNMPSCIYELL